MKDTMKGMYIACANTLGYGDITKLKTNDSRRKQIITECADGYILATKLGNEEKRSAYISALMLMFYGEISKMASKCKGVPELDYEDFAVKLYECIDIACSYAAWKDGKHTAEACIRSVIASRGAAAILYESNLDKNKINVNLASLDCAITDDEGRETTKLDLMIDEDEEAEIRADNTASLIVQTYLDRNKIVEGIIFDLIVNNDCQRYTKQTKTVIEDGEENNYTTTTAEFWGYKLVQLMSKLPDNYFNYFKNKYSVNDEILKNTLDTIKKCDNQRLYKYLNKALSDAKTRFAELQD